VADASNGGVGNSVSIEVNPAGRCFVIELELAFGVCKALDLFELRIGFLDASSDLDLASEVSMTEFQSTELSKNIGRALTLIISGSMDAWRQISLWTSRGNNGKKVKSSAVVETEVEVEPLLKDKEESEREDIV
jgi:hypothetical protein